MDVFWICAIKQSTESTKWGNSAKKRLKLMLSVKSNITTSMSLAFAIHKVIRDVMLRLCSFWNWPLTMFILSFHTWYFATPSYYHFWSRPNVCGFSSDIFFSLAPLEFGHFILITSFFFFFFCFIQTSVLLSQIPGNTKKGGTPPAWNMFE